jgi:hypothetical protein
MLLHLKGSETNEGRDESALQLCSHNTPVQFHLHVAEVMSLGLSAPKWNNEERVPKRQQEVPFSLNLSVPN